MFDVAHQCGTIAGKGRANPLNIRAHFITIRKYKSLAGPAGSLIVRNAAKSVALAVKILDWRIYGEVYTKEVKELSKTLAMALDQLGVGNFYSIRRLYSVISLCIISKALCR